jgi:phage major head subunit gpT-like protein
LGIPLGIIMGFTLWRITYDLQMSIDTNDYWSGTDAMRKHSCSARLAVVAQLTVINGIITPITKVIYHYIIKLSSLV